MTLPYTNTVPILVAIPIRKIKKNAIKLEYQDNIHNLKISIKYYP